MTSVGPSSLATRRGELQSVLGKLAREYIAPYGVAEELKELKSARESMMELQRSTCRNVPAAAAAGRVRCANNAFADVVRLRPSLVECCLPTIITDAEDFGVLLELLQAPKTALRFDIEHKPAPAAELRNALVGLLGTAPRDPYVWLRHNRVRM